LKLLQKIKISSKTAYFLEKPFFVQPLTNVKLPEEITFGEKHHMIMVRLRK